MINFLANYIKKLALIIPEGILNSFLLESTFQKYSSNMMKYLVLLALVVLAVESRPQNDPKDAVILKSSNNNEGTGNYQWNYESSDGSKQDQTGELKKNRDPKEADFQTAQGSFSYLTPDGKNVLVTYTADEGGYKVKTTYQ